MSASFVLMLLISGVSIFYLVYKYKNMPPITLRGYDIISKNGIRVRLALVKGTYRGYVSEAFINNKSLYFHDEFGFYIDTKTNNNFKAEQIIKNNMYW